MSPLRGEGPADQVGSQKLERDGTAELFVDRFVDPTHPAFPELFEDFVMRDGLTGHGFGLALSWCSSPIIA